MKRKIIVLLMSILLLAIIGCNKNNESSAEAQTESKKEKIVFKIGGIPDQNASKLNRRLQELAEYIGDKTDLEVEYVPTVDYSALVTAFERGEVHLAWFGGLTGVQARNLTPNSEAIAQRPRDEEFHSVFIAQKKLNITQLSDIKGKRFTFGSESSTSGHLMPRFFMGENGIDADGDLDGAPNYSGSHDKTWKLVESGAFQAGALNEAVWESAVAKNKVDLNKVQVFYTTPAYYDYNWTINNVDPIFGLGTKDKVKKALLTIGDDKKEIMELFQTDKFIESKNENYDAISSVAKKLNIIK